MANRAPVLITGFEPFGGETTNASWEAVSLLPASIAGHEVRRLLLPVEFGRSADLLLAEMGRLQPAAVIAVGEAGGRAHVTVERVAVNIMRGRIPDNAGYQASGEAVVEGGPAAYLATLPVDACVAAARSQGVPTDPSETAGLYVCNQLMYRMLHAISQASLDIQAGFVHVPHTARQVLDRAGIPFIPADYSARALVGIVEATLC